MRKTQKIDFSLLGIFGDSPTIRLWRFLLLGRGFEYHITDLSKGSGISRPTCYIEVRKMLAKEIIVKGGKYHGKQLYTLNMNSPVVKIVLNTFTTMLREL